MDGLLSNVEVGDIWGIGPAYARFLKKHGITNARELRDADDKWIRKNLTVVGLRLVRELRGEPSIALELSPQPRKAAGATRSFGGEVETLEEMEEAVSAFTARAAEKIRREKLRAGALTVFIGTNRFKDAPQYYNSATVGLPVATADSGELIAIGLRLLRGIFAEGYRYKRAGILLTDLAAEGMVQPDLFEKRDEKRSAKLMKVLNGVNETYGRNRLQYAVQGLSPKANWQTKFERRSPRYTTRWDELPKIILT